MKARSDIRWDHCGASSDGCTEYLSISTIIYRKSLAASWLKPVSNLTYYPGLHKHLEPTGHLWPLRPPFIGLKFLDCGRLCSCKAVTVPRHSLRPSWSCPASQPAVHPASQPGYTQSYRAVARTLTAILGTTVWETDWLAFLEHNYAFMTVLADILSSDGKNCCLPTGKVMLKTIKCFGWKNMEII